MHHYFHFPPLSLPPSLSPSVPPPSLFLSLFSSSPAPPFSTLLLFLSPPPLSLSSQSPLPPSGLGSDKSRAAHSPRPLLASPRRKQICSAASGAAGPPRRRHSRPVDAAQCAQTHQRPSIIVQDAFCGGVFLASLSGRPVHGVALMVG